MSWKFPAVLLCGFLLLAVVCGPMCKRAAQPTAQAPRTPDVAVTNLRWNQKSHLDYVDGDGANTSGHALRSVLVRINISDKQHRRLGTLVAVFSNLATGERFAIHEWCTYNDAAYFELGEITAY